MPNKPAGAMQHATPIKLIPKIMSLSAAELDVRGVAIAGLIASLPPLSTTCDRQYLQYRLAQVHAAQMIRGVMDIGRAPKASCG